jgi:hypothetical protein
MVILHFLATVLWIGMLLGFLFAVFWALVAVVLIRGYKRWVNGDEQIEPEQDLLDDA